MKKDVRQVCKKKQEEKTAPCKHNSFVSPNSHQPSRANELLDRVMGIMDDDVQCLLVSRILGPMLVEEAAPTEEGYTWLVQQLLQSLRQPYVGEYVRAYCVRARTRLRIVAEAGLASELEQVRDRGANWITEDDVKVIYVRKELWGSLTVVRVTWAINAWTWPSEVEVVRLFPHTGGLASFMSRSSYVTSMSEEQRLSPHPLIHFPTEETVASLRAVADTNFGSTPTIPLCTMALMLLDAQGSEDAHHMSQNEWVIGLKNRERHLQ